MAETFVDPADRLVWSSYRISSAIEVGGACIKSVAEPLWSDEVEKTTMVVLGEYPFHL